MKKISYIIWDLDNTVWRPREDEVDIIIGSILKPKGRERLIHEFPIGLENIKEQFYSFHKEFSEVFLETKVTEKKILKLFIGLTEVALMHYDILPIEFWEEWQTRSKTIDLNEKVTEVLEKLKRENCRNIVLTDWIKSTQLRRLKENDLLEYFELVHACDGQYLKSNPKATKRIEGIIEVARDNAVIIGDSLGSDIAFGNRAGIMTIWYNDKNKENNTNIKPDYEISSLQEIGGILL